MDMRKSPIVIILSLLICTAAQAGNGGSGYSIYGIGDLQYYSSSRAMGMGGSGLAVLSSGEIDRNNPALWSSINRVRVSLSTMYEGYATSDDQQSGYFASMQFSGAMLAIPAISSRSIVFSAGATPYSRVNYNVLTPTAQGDLPYALHYIGDGGLSQAHIGVSGLPDSNLSIGIKMDYYFGTLTHTIDQEFPATGYTNAAVDHVTHMHGIGFTFGFVYTGLRSILNLSPGHSFNIAGVLSTASNITTAEDRYYTYTTNATAYDTLIGADHTFHLPVRFSGGLAYQTDRWIIASDITGQRWSQATMDGEPFPEIRDDYRWSLGGELISSGTTMKATTQRVAYRAGLYYDATYYRIKGIAVNELGFSLGCTLPIFSDSRLGFAAEYSFRGTIDEGLQKDRILRLSISLSVGEIWFVKPPEE